MLENRISAEDRPCLWQVVPPKVGTVIDHDNGQKLTLIAVDLYTRRRDGSRGAKLHWRAECGAKYKSWLTCQMSKFTGA